MVNKHFFKTLILFTVIIFFGLVSILIVSYFDQRDTEAEKIDTSTEVAN